MRRCPTCQQPLPVSDTSLVPADVTAIEYATNGPTKAWVLTQTQITLWQRDYPHLDVLQECRKAKNWLEANHRKTAAGMRRFLVAWLNRANDRPHRQNGQHAPQVRRTAVEANLDGLRADLRRDDW